jgi:hypothetical protein
MNDHQWMDVPDGIAVVLISLHPKWYVSHCFYEYTLTHGDTVALFYCLPSLLLVFVKPTEIL